MIASTCFCICAYSIAFAIYLSCEFLIILKAVVKVVGINKVLTRIIGWVYQDAMFDTKKKAFSGV